MLDLNSLKGQRVSFQVAVLTASHTRMYLQAYLEVTGSTLRERGLMERNEENGCVVKDIWNHIFHIDALL